MPLYPDVSTFLSMHLSIQYLFQSAPYGGQQSPPSQLHSALLVASSHNPSLVHDGKLQALGDGVDVEGNGLVDVIGNWVVEPQILVVPPPIRSD